METTTTPRVWIGCLASYNAGRLIGEWVDATDTDEMREAQDRVSAAAITAAKESGDWPVYFGTPEEFFIADYDGFGTLPSTLGEYPDWETVATIGAAIENHGEAFALFIEACEPDLSEPDNLTEHFGAVYRGEWDSEKDYAYDYVEQCGWGGCESIPEGLDNYLDWDAITRVLFMSDYTSAQGSDYKVHVFEPNAY